jgi:hypothetical protein
MFTTLEKSLRNAGLRDISVDGVDVSRIIMRTGREVTIPPFTKHTELGILFDYIFTCHFRRYVDRVLTCVLPREVR